MATIDNQEFHNAMERFKDLVERCKSGDQVLGNHADKVALMSAIEACQRKFESRKQSKVHKWISRLSVRIVLYGNILDALVQHHPEYVALVWGSFKLIFQGVINHEELAKELAKAFCRIGDALPLVEQELILHPSEKMATLVMQMHTKVIEFAERALKWYNASKLKHTILAITHPYRLHFKDLVEDIIEISRRIDKMALSMSMAELRQTRVELQGLCRENNEIRDLVKVLKKTLDGFHKVQFANLLDTNKRVCEIQLSQIMAFADTTLFLDPQYCLEYVRVRRNHRHARGQEENFLLTNVAQLQDWGNKPCSSQLAVRGSFETRHAAHDFSTNLIEQIQSSSIPVIWVLNTRRPGDEEYTPSDVLKYLVSQILHQNQNLLNERAAAMNAAAFQRAKTTENWMNLLGSALTGLPLVYVVLDMDVLANCLTSEATTWPERFRKLCFELVTRNTGTILKIVFVSTRSGQMAQLGPFKESDVLRIMASRRGREKRNRRRWESHSKRGRAKLQLGLLGDYNPRETQLGT